jgi:hypothetical protein
MKKGQKACRTENINVVGRDNDFAPKGWWR